MTRNLGLVVGLLAGVVLQVACAPGDDNPGTDYGADYRPDYGGDVPPDVEYVEETLTCTPGEWGCAGNTRFQCGPDGHSRINETPCEHACDTELGCVFCRPGSRRCEGSVSMFCAADGDSWVTGRDCAEWGSACSATGYCADACGEAESSRSYVGCEYWPTPLANTAELNSATFDFRVIVGNPGGVAANITVTRGGATAYTGSVPAGGLLEIPLPWVEGQSFGIEVNEWNSLLVRDGAFRLRSDQPVTVSQFNPFEYSVGATFSYTNDATLLLPSHVLTGDYVGLTYVPFSRATGTTGMFPTPPSFAKYPDYLAVVGIAPEPTEVEVFVTGHTVADRSGAIPAAGAWTPIRFTLARGQVAHIASSAPPNCVGGRPGHHREEECTMGMCDYLDTCREHEHDLTGSRITADRPVLVFGGHVCAYVPYTSQACDHLEVQLAPVQTWGRDFATAPMTDGGGPGDNLVRVVAAFDETFVTVSPPQDGIADVTLHANEWVEFMAHEPIHVTGSKAIQVGQFLLGQNYTNPAAARGDPAMTVLVPNEQFRPDYTFVSPSSYNPGTNGQSFVMIIRPPGMALTLDGSPVSTSWRGVGGREIGIVPVAGGTHTITGAEPFGMIAYGLGSYTSYAYPAGLNLEQITILI